MRLYEVPRNSIIQVKGKIQVPPAAPEIKKGQTLRFFHLDGAYSYCQTMDGKVCHLAAWAEVEVIRKMKKREIDAENI